jgi:AcrR family transcriptional regulator
MARSGRRAEASLAESGAGSKQAILDAALQSFARTGYDGASMPGIARIAGVAPALIHYHFNTKENLWHETVDYSLGHLKTEAMAVLRATHSLAPLDRLRALLQVFAEFAARCPDHFSMIVAEARADSDRFAWLHKNYTGLLFDETVAILEDARDAGAIKDIALNELTVVLIGGILVQFTIYPSQASEVDADQASRRFVDFLFGLLTGGVLTERA